jgi:hypothetical protein
LESLDPRVGDPGIVEVQLLKLLEPFEVGQPGIPDPGLIELEPA